MSIQKKIIDWIKQRNAGDEEFALLEDTDISQTGYLDSMGFVGFIVFLEDLGAKNTDSLVSDSEKYKTVNDIVKLCFE